MRLRYSVEEIQIHYMDKHQQAMFFFPLLEVAPNKLKNGF